MSTTSNNQVILIAFGGYNGHYINEVCPLTFKKNGGNLYANAIVRYSHKIPVAGLCNEDQVTIKRLTVSTSSPTQ